MMIFISLKGQLIYHLILPSHDLIIRSYVVPSVFFLRLKCKVILYFLLS